MSWFENWDRVAPQLVDATWETLYMVGISMVLTLLLGDGLVRVSSAAGRGGRPLCPPRDVQVVPGVGHLQLAHHPAVYARLRACLQEAP